MMPQPEKTSKKNQRGGGDEKRQGKEKTKHRARVVLYRVYTIGKQGGSEHVPKICCFICLSQKRFILFDLSLFFFWLSFPQKTSPQTHLTPLPREMNVFSRSCTPPLIFFFRLPPPQNRK
eukprot:TRINITY_DN6069_c0_g1_i1.p1 TRINITY_DN6069_c0_g1~~TRINITY_DN6069_c0_g1_i1.p1  ORF type:complete len:120 (+),score=3.48 TRINITY_DN6069_c0_g1_i1:221-580(+)